MIAIVRASGSRMLAELTSSSLTASTSPRRHAPRKTNRATNSATSCPAPASTNTPETNASPASPNHGTELVFSFLSDMKLRSGQSRTRTRCQHPDQRSQRHQHPGAARNRGSKPAAAAFTHRSHLRGSRRRPPGFWFRDARSHEAHWPRYPCGHRCGSHPRRGEEPAVRQIRALSWPHASCVSQAHW